VEKWPRKPSMCAQAAKRSPLNWGSLPRRMHSAMWRRACSRTGRSGSRAAGGVGGGGGAGGVGGWGGGPAHAAATVGARRRPVAARCQGAGRETRSGGGLDGDGAGGLVDGGGERGEGGPGGRGGGRPGGSVEPDDGVEVDDAAALVFGDLGVGDPDLRVQGEP